MNKLGRIDMFIIAIFPINMTFFSMKLKRIRPPPLAPINVYIPNMMVLTQPLVHADSPIYVYICYLKLGIL